MNHTPTAFILMPFAPEFDEIYEFLIRGALVDAGFNVSRADDIRNQQNILSDVVQGIISSDIIVADLSKSNPNVYYELGLSHAIRKPVILLTQEIEEIPFDLRSYRILTYGTHFARMNVARKELTEIAKGAREKSIQFGNPILDFTTIRSHINFDHENVAGQDERGLLDFHAELEKGVEILSSIMGEVGKRFNILTPELQTATEQIQRHTDISKRRSIIRGLAVTLEEYAKWLRQANTEYRQALGSVSESLNVLFSGEFDVTDDDKSDLYGFVLVLQQVEQQAQVGQSSISELVKIMDSLPRIEKEFNRAKRSVSDELKELMGNIEQTIAVFVRARNAAAHFLGM